MTNNSLTPQEAYDKLIKRFREASIIESCANVLDWDEQTYMPQNGADLRDMQYSLLDEMFHKMTTSPEIGELLEAVEGTDLTSDPESPQAVNVRMIRRYYDKNVKLPTRLVKAISEIGSKARQAWKEGKKNNDFSVFQPWLEKLIPLLQEKADCFGFKGERYNALLDEFEPSMTVAEIDDVFSHLREDLVELLGRIKSSERYNEEIKSTGIFPLEPQKKFIREVVETIGFSFESGRIDEAAHPFCSGIGVGDNRITTRYDESRINIGLFDLMHEAGHALYEMGLDKENHFGTPMAEAISTGIHESQSLTWENRVGRGKPFWVYFYPRAQEAFRDTLKSIVFDDFYRSVNRVRPSYIRIDADEVTYCLHILLRYELERALINGDMNAADIPGEWDNRFKEYFGIEVDKISNGCLQDIHWASGYMGYFPTYAFGHLYSAQFYEAALKENPAMESQFERGDFSRLLNWSRKNIHLHGQRYLPNDLAVKATGKKLSHKPFIEYLNRKFGQIYQL